MLNYPNGRSICLMPDGGGGGGVGVAAGVGVGTGGRSGKGALGCGAAVWAWGLALLILIAIGFTIFSLFRDVLDEENNGGETQRSETSLQAAPESREAESLQYGARQLTFCSDGSAGEWQN